MNRGSARSNRLWARFLIFTRTCPNRNSPATRLSCVPGWRTGIWNDTNPGMTVLGTTPASAAKATDDCEGDDFDRAADALQREKEPRHPRLRAAAELIRNNDFGTAGKLLREFLRLHPRDVL